MRSNEDFYAYVNGKFVKNKSASISVFDRGLMYGDGVYEAIRLHEHFLYRIDDHMRRLENGLKYLRIKSSSLTAKFVFESLMKTINYNSVKDGYFRIIVTRGKSKMGVDPRNAKEPTLLIFMEDRKPLSLGKYSSTAKIVTVQQPHINALDPRIKTLNYLNKVLATLECLADGYDHPILLTSEGYVTEAGTENIFVEYEGELYTPNTEIGLLPGITRDSVIKISKHLGIKVNEILMKQDFLKKADLIFLTGTSAGLVPLSKLDKKRFNSNSDILSRLSENYIKSLNNEIPFITSFDTRKWPKKSLSLK